MLSLLVSLPGRAQEAPPATAEPPAAPTPTPTAAPPPQPVGADQPAGIRLRSLEQRVQALKEQAWRTKARVGMLKESVLGGGIGARAIITHQNKMGGSFRMVKLVYALDGQQIFSRSDDTGKLNDLKSIDILSGPIAPGNHTLSVTVVYRGNGYGVFAYLKDHKFPTKRSHTFTVTEGKQTSVTVVGFEKGGITAKMEDRPAIDFRIGVTQDKPSVAPAK